MKDKAATPAAVIPIGAAKRKPVIPGKAVKESEPIWGKDVMDQKFVIVPKLLLRAQARLGLDPAQLRRRKSIKLSTSIGSRYDL